MEMKFRLKKRNMETVNKDNESPMQINEKISRMDEKKIFIC